VGFEGEYDAPPVLPSQLERLTMQSPYESDGAPCRAIVCQPSCRHLVVEAPESLTPWIDGLLDAGLGSRVNILEIRGVQTVTSDTFKGFMSSLKQTVTPDSFARLVHSLKSVSELRIPSSWAKHLDSPEVRYAFESNKAIMSLRLFDKNGNDVSEVPSHIGACLQRNQMMANDSVRAASSTYGGQSLGANAAAIFGERLAQTGVPNHHDYASFMALSSRAVNSARAAQDRTSQVHAQAIQSASDAQNQALFAKACLEVKDYALAGDIKMERVVKMVTRYLPTITRQQFAVIQQVVADATAERMQGAFAHLLVPD
jgi:hypothetical protein